MFLGIEIKTTKKIIEIAKQSQTMIFAPLCFTVNTGKYYRAFLLHDYHIALHHSYFLCSKTFHFNHLNCHTYFYIVSEQVSFFLQNPPNIIYDNLVCPG